MAPLPRYPYGPGYKDPVSQENAEAFGAKRARTRREAVLDELHKVGAATTAEAIAERLGHHWSTIRPRFTELHRMGLVQKTGDRGKGPCGGTSTIWRLSTADEVAAFKATQTEATA